MNLLEAIDIRPGSFCNKINSLVERYKLDMKFCENDTSAILNYDIHSPRKHGVTDQCRGHIVSLDKDGKAYYKRRMFDRFYNVGEYTEMEKDFDWSTAVVEEKADGSIIGVWFSEHSNRWEIGSRGNPVGDNEVTTLTNRLGSITFRNLFIRAIGGEAVWEKITGFLDDMSTYIFELCTFENQIVTNYKVDTVYLLGVRNNITGEERDDNLLRILAGWLGVKRPETYQVGSFGEAFKAANELTDLKEGFVLRDADKRRLKVKSVSYVAAHHLRGNGKLTPKRLVNLIWEGQQQEFLLFFPHAEDALNRYESRKNQVISEIVSAFETIKHFECKKQFAQKAVEGFPEYKTHLFNMKNRGWTVEQSISGLTEANRVRLLSPVDLDLDIEPELG